MNWFFVTWAWSYQKNSQKKSSEFWPNSQISENSPGLGPINKIFWKIPRNFDQILRFLKIPQIFWKCDPIKIPCKKSPEFFPDSCTKIFRFFVRKLALSTNSQKNPQNLNSPNFPQKSDKFFDKFWFSMLDKIQSIFYRVFLYEHFSEICMRV